MIEGNKIDRQDYPSWNRVRNKLFDIYVDLGNSTNMARLRIGAGLVGLEGPILTRLLGLRGR